MLKKEIEVLYAEKNKIGGDKLLIVRARILYLVYYTTMFENNIVAYRSHPAHLVRQR